MRLVILIFTNNNTKIFCGYYTINDLWKAALWTNYNQFYLRHPHRWTFSSLVTIQNGGLFCNVAAYSAMWRLILQRLVDSGTLLIAHSKYTFLNTQNENVRYQATKQHVFKDECEYEAFRGVNLSCNKWVMMIFLVQIIKITLLRDIWKLFQNHPASPTILAKL